MGFKRDLLQESELPKLAVTKNFRRLACARMPLGLGSGTQAFQVFNDEAKLKLRNAYLYLDLSLAHSQEQHSAHRRALFDRCSKNGSN